MYVLHVVHWNIPKSISELAKYTQLTNHRTQSWCHFMVSKHSPIMYSAHLTLKTTVSVSNKSFICYDKLLEIIYGITTVKKVERFIASITTSPIGQAVILPIRTRYWPWQPCWISDLHQNLVEDHPMNIYGKFGWNLFSGFREEELNVKS
jgi:hypothetical protein